MQEFGGYVTALVKIGAMDELSPLRAVSPPHLANDSASSPTPQKRRRRKQTTNDFFRDVLDNDVRSKWKTKSKSSKKAAKKGRRLSTLYSKIQQVRL